MDLSVIRRSGDHGATKVCTTTVSSDPSLPAFSTTTHAELSAFLARADCSQYLTLLLGEKLDLEVLNIYLFCSTDVPIGSLSPLNCGSSSGGYLVG